MLFNLDIDYIFQQLRYTSVCMFPLSLHHASQMRITVGSAIRMCTLLTTAPSLPTSQNNAIICVRCVKWSSMNNMTCHYKHLWEK